MVLKVVSLNEKCWAAEQRGMLCNKQCSWEGWCEGLIYCWRLSCSCQHSEMFILHSQMRLCTWMCVASFCLFVYLVNVYMYVCVCVWVFVCVSVLSTSDGKRPGSSSSFGTRGNMTQMDAISPNRQGPAAQEAQTHTENNQTTILKHSLRCAVCF